jgi:hypothetical protein
MGSKISSDNENIIYNYSHEMRNKENDSFDVAHRVIPYGWYVLCRYLTDGPLTKSSLITNHAILFVHPSSMSFISYHKTEHFSAAILLE